MLFDHVLGMFNDLLAKDDGQYRENAESQQTSADDGQSKLPHFHLERTRRKYQQFERRGWWKHGGNHDSQELPFLETVAYSLQPGLIDAFEQEQFASCATQPVRNQTACGRAHSGRHAIEPGLVRIGIDKSRD